MVGCEHDPARRGHDVEGAVPDTRHGLAVAYLIVDLEPLLTSALVRRLQQDRREVEADNGSTRSGRALGNGAGAAGEVEESLPGLRVEARDHELVDVASACR